MAVAPVPLPLALLLVAVKSPDGALLNWSRVTSTLGFDPLTSIATSTSFNWSFPAVANAVAPLVHGCPAPWAVGEGGQMAPTAPLVDAVSTPNPSIPVVANNPVPAKTTAWWTRPEPFP